MIKRISTGSLHGEHFIVFSANGYRYRYTNFDKAYIEDLWDRARYKAGKVFNRLRGKLERED